MMKLALCVVLLAVLVSAVAATSVPYRPYPRPMPRPWPPRPVCRPCPNTCRGAICPRFRSAVCRVMPCTCQRRWYVRVRVGYYGYYRDVTALCYTRPYQPFPYPIGPGPVIHPRPVGMPGHPILGYYKPKPMPMPSPNKTEEPMNTSMESPAPMATPVSSPKPVEVESDDSCNLECNGGDCKIDSVTGLPYCEPSCKVNNGGCPAGMECMMRNVQCTRAPCPKVVECVATQMKG